MGKENLYAVCKDCVHTCTDQPCEAFLALGVLQSATELGLDEIQYNLGQWLKKG